MKRYNTDMRPSLEYLMLSNPLKHYNSIVLLLKKT